MANEARGVDRGRMARREPRNAGSVVARARGGDLVGAARKNRKSDAKRCKMMHSQLVTHSPGALRNPLTSCAALRMQHPRKRQKCCIWLHFVASNDILAWSAEKTQKVMQYDAF